MVYYLYIKTSPEGLKYLGTTTQDPYKYKGSGKRWKSHIIKHKFKASDIVTDIIFQTADRQLLSDVSKLVSCALGVVASTSWANLVEETGTDGVSMIGETNPNWKGGVSTPKCVCGALIASVNSSCASCRHRDGKSNPFFGRQHSGKTKEMISKANKGKMPVNTLEIEIDGTLYRSASFAGKELGISPVTVLNRSRSHKFPNYKIKAPLNT